jgi:hypothetical protein
MAFSSRTSFGFLHASQVTAALALIQIKVSPAVSIHIPFGGDNHSDRGLMEKAQQTAGTGPSLKGLTGVPGVTALMSAFYAAKHDQVTFMSLNVFGRTLATSTGARTGRQHNPEHRVARTIGKGWKAGVIGGVAPGGKQQDYGAVAIDSKTGVGSPGGDIAPFQSLSFWEKTAMAGLRIDSAIIAQLITAGTVTSGALA